MPESSSLVLTPPTMHKCAGGDLYEQLKRNGRLKEQEVASQVRSTPTGPMFSSQGGRQPSNHAALIGRLHMRS